MGVISKGGKGGRKKGPVVLASTVINILVILETARIFTVSNLLYIFGIIGDFRRKVQREAE